MQVNSKTKISILLKDYPQALDCIAEINPNFKKLRNSLLRKAFAPRVNIRQAAKIGGISTNEFLIKLQKAGIPVEFEQEENTNRLTNLQD